MPPLFRECCQSTPSSTPSETRGATNRSSVGVTLKFSMWSRVFAPEGCASVSSRLE
jgi:hypothetical protein